MSVQKLRLSYTTTDGRPFTDAKEAARHQNRLDAIEECAEILATTFELDKVVGVNIAALLADQPETLCRLMGRVYRKPKDENDAGDAGDPAAPVTDTTLD